MGTQRTYRDVWEAGALSGARDHSENLLFICWFPRVEREARDASRRLLKLLLKLLLKPISILTGIVPYYIDKLSRLASLAGESSDIRVISLVGSLRSLGNHLISK